MKDRTPDSRQGRLASHHNRPFKADRAPESWPRNRSDTGWGCGVCPACGRRRANRRAPRSRAAIRQARSSGGPTVRHRRSVMVDLASFVSGRVISSSLRG
jgi:hypothetical protein